MNKSLWSLWWPLLIGMGLSLSLNITDAFFLSRVSDDAAAALGALLPVLLICFSVFFAMGQAGAAVGGQLLGARKPESAAQAFSSLLFLHLALGALFSACFWALRSALPQHLGLESPIAEHAETYLAWVGSAQVIRSMQIAYNNILNSVGATHRTMLEGIVTNVCNLGLNTLFLDGSFGLDSTLAGVRGVAFATVASMSVGALLSASFVHIEQGIRIRLAWTSTQKALQAILRIGAPSALEPMAYNVSQALITMLVVQLGAAALAARTYVMNLMLLCILWSAALGAAVQITVAHRIGEQRFGEASTQLKRGLRLGLAGGATISLALLALRYPVLAVFTQSPAVVAAAAPLFFVAFVGECGRPANIIVGGALRSCGDARFTSFVGASVMLGFSVPAAYLFGFVLDLGLVGIWIAIALDEVIRGVINWLRWRSGVWRDRGVLKTSPALA